MARGYAELGSFFFFFNLCVSFYVKKKKKGYNSCKCCLISRPRRSTRAEHPRRIQDDTLPYFNKWIGKPVFLLLKKLNDTSVFSHICIFSTHDRARIFPRPERIQLDKICKDTRAIFFDHSGMTINHAKLKYKVYV